MLGHADHFVGGLAVASVIGTSGLGGPLVARLRPRTAMLTGTVLLLVGTLAVLAALAVRNTPGFFATSMVAGLGLGASFFGGMRTLVAPITPLERATVLSAAYLVAYLGTAIPSFFAGVLTPRWGLPTVTNGYGALVIGLGLLAILLTARRRRPTRP